MGVLRVATVFLHSTTPQISHERRENGYEASVPLQTRRLGFTIITGISCCARGRFPPSPLSQLVRFSTSSNEVSGDLSPQCPRIEMNRTPENRFLFNPSHLIGFLCAVRSRSGFKSHPFLEKRSFLRSRRQIAGQPQPSGKEVG